MRRSLKNIVLAGFAALSLGALSSCGPKEVPKPQVEHIYITQEYNGGQFPGDKTFISYDGSNLPQSCDLDIENSFEKVKITDVKPGETVTTTFGDPNNLDIRGQIYPGENTFSIICNDVNAGSTTVNFEAAKIDYSIVGSDPSDKNLITAWTYEGIGRGSLNFEVSMTTNIDHNRISSYGITFGPTDDTKQIVEKTFSEEPLPIFYDTLKPDLSSKTYNGSSASISYPLPGGLADLTLKVYTVDGKSLSRIERLVLRAGSPDGSRVLGVLYPIIADDGTYTIVDNSAPDIDPTSGNVTYRIIAFTAAEDPSSVGFRATNLDNGEYYDDTGNFSAGNPLVGGATYNYFNGTPNSMNVKYEAVFPDGNNPSVTYQVIVESDSP